MTTDNNQEVGSPKNTNNGEVAVTQKGGKSKQYLYAVLASIGAVICGCAAFWSPPKYEISVDLNLQDFSVNAYLGAIVRIRSKNAAKSMEELSMWLSYWFLCGAILGALPAGYVAGRFGRKVTLMGSSIPWICAWLISAETTKRYTLYASRFICGIFTGVFSTVIPMYLTEIAEDSVRGALGTMFHVFFTFGFLLVVFLDFISLNYFCVALTTACFVSSFFIVESPVFLSRKNVNSNKVEEVLKRLRGPRYNVDIELCNLRNQDEITSRPNLNALFISIVLMVGQKFCGMDYIVSSAPNIFLGAQWTSTSVASLTIIGVVQTLATFLSCFLVDRVGRKNLLVASGVGMALCLFILAPLTDIYGSGNINASLVIVFVVAYSIGFGPLPWIIPGELFPPRTRKVACGITVAANWMAGFLIFLFSTFALDTIVNNLSVAVVFVMFALMSVISTAFVLLFLPETMGKPRKKVQPV